jgi:hypothetical protein
MPPVAKKRIPAIDATRIVAATVVAPTSPRAIEVAGAQADAELAVEHGHARRHSAFRSNGLFTFQRGAQVVGSGQALPDD